MSKVLNYCRAVWGSSAERTKQRNREEEENKFFLSCFNFPVGYEGRGGIRQINSEVCLCQCRVWIGIEREQGESENMLLFIAPLQNDPKKTTHSHSQSVKF